MIFVFFTAKYKEDCSFFSTVIAMMACMAQSQADVYRSVKRNPKNVCFKNLDLKKGVRLDNILHTTYYTTLFVRNKRLNIFLKENILFFLKRKYMNKRKKRTIVIDFG